MRICSTSRPVDADGGADCVERKADSLPWKILMVATVLTLLGSGCAAYRAYEASKPETVRKTEAALSDAGFTTIKLDNEDKEGLVEDLPPHEIRSYGAQSGPVYWYYDPDICACVYEGHEAEFDRYQVALEHQNDVAQYTAESSDQQVASLNALNGGFFPPPIFWVGGFAPIPHFDGGGRHFGGHGGGGGGFRGVGGGGHGGGGGGHR